jgi:hypothetical protein
MMKYLMFVAGIFTLPLIGDISPPKVGITGPLEESALKTLVSGNSLIGTSSSVEDLYELYFDPDGTLYFRKNSDNGQFHVGKWWITGKVIHSQWPTYKKKPNENAMYYYHLYDNCYLSYNFSDDSGKNGTFSSPFLAIKGKHSFVEEAFKSQKK